MPRGRARAVYMTDTGLLFWVWVDRDSLEDPNRGWVETTPEAHFVLGRGILPRRVVGVDDLGRTAHARVARVDAALWTGGVATWSYEGSDGVLHTATVISRQQERTYS